MIEEMFKYLLVGPQSARDDFFAKAQQSGFAEFIAKEKQKELFSSEKSDCLMRAIDELKKYPVTLQQTTEVTTPLEMAQKICALSEVARMTQEELRVLEGEIVRIEPLGEVEIEELSRLEKSSGYKVKFFCFKQGKEECNLPDNFIYISSSFDIDYFMALVDEEENFAPCFVEIPFTRSLKELLAARERAVLRAKELHDTLSDLASFSEFLREALMEETNFLLLQGAIKGAKEALEDRLFVTEAWVPASHKKAFEALWDKMPIHFEEVAEDPKEVIPTAMKNSGFARIGQDLIELYDTPNRKDPDTSVWVLSFFILFFSMIIADAGYGIIFFLLAAYAKYKNPLLKGAKKRMLTLFTLLAAGSTLWGVVTCEFFSIHFPPTSVFQKVSFVHALAKQKAAYRIALKDQDYLEIEKEFPAVAKASTPDDFFANAVESDEHGISYPIMEQFHQGILAEVAILIGIIHLLISFTLNLKRTPAGFGWMLALIGGYLYAPSVVEMTSMVNFLGIISPESAKEIGIQLLGIGVGFAVIVTTIKIGLAGIEELFKVVQLFGDVLSYIRLYALGLASMQLAAAVNMMGASFGFAIGLFVILIGHGFNLMLGTMGGVMHGLRLNFLEWYRHCFEGEGRRFSPLRLLGEED